MSSLVKTCGVAMEKVMFFPAGDKMDTLKLKKWKKKNKMDVLKFEVFSLSFREGSTLGSFGHFVL